MESKGSRKNVQAQYKVLQERPGHKAPKRFKKNEVILGLTMEWVSERLLSRIDKAILNSDTVVSGLRSVFMTHVDFVSSHPSLPGVALSCIGKKNTLASKFIMTLLSSYRARLAGLIDKGVANNELPAQLDSSLAATVFIGSVQGLIVQSLITNDLAFIEREASNTFECMMSGLLAGTPCGDSVSKNILNVDEVNYINNIFKETLNKP